MGQHICIGEQAQLPISARRRRLPPKRDPAGAADPRGGATLLHSTNSNICVDAIVRSYNNVASTRPRDRWDDHGFSEENRADSRSSARSRGWRPSC
jgi:hypothetical protein